MGSNPNMEMEQLNIDLFLACQNGEWDRAKKDIDEGADVNAKDYCEWTPLHDAVRFGWVRIVHLLLDNGANVDAKNNGGWTPLHLAVFGNRFGITILLLENNANPNVTDNNGSTPLYLAVSTNNKEIEQLLINAGAKYTFFLIWIAFMSKMGSALVETWRRILSYCLQRD